METTIDFSMYRRYIGVMYYSIYSCEESTRRSLAVKSNQPCGGSTPKSSIHSR